MNTQPNPYCGPVVQDTAPSRLNSFFVFLSTIFLVLTGSTNKNNLTLFFMVLTRTMTMFLLSMFSYSILLKTILLKQKCSVHLLKLMFVFIPHHPHSYPSPMPFSQHWLAIAICSILSFFCFVFFIPYYLFLYILLTLKFIVISKQPG